jgi:hypothetical protein
LENGGIVELLESILEYVTESRDELDLLSLRLQELIRHHREKNKKHPARSLRERSHCSDKRSGDLQFLQDPYEWLKRLSLRLHG